MRNLHLLLLWIVSTCVVYSQPHTNMGKNDLAIEGYDPVAYFSEHLPIKGSSELTYIYEGAKYYFASFENKTMFVEDPTRYLPQYGGWCAYAIGKSAKKVNVNPKSFHVRKNKLYLFYKKGSYDALDKWKEKEEVRNNADKNWEEITSKK